MRVLFFWERQVTSLDLDQQTNPYGPLLSRAMAKRGVTLELGDHRFDKEWLKRRRPDCDVIHFNWLNHFYRAETLAEATRRVRNLAENTHYARQLGYRIVWTFHNLYPHERPFPDLDHAAQLMMCRQADAVICHCRYAADLLDRHFHRRHAVHVIPHGNYIDAYPNEVSRESAREALGIPDDAFVYWFAGNARPYKGIERLIEAFRALDDPKRHLILMMRTGVVPGYGESLVSSTGDDRIHCATSPFFGRSAFQNYANAADVAVLPFVDVLTSGSAILALGFGKPLVVPAIGCLPELVDTSCGVLFDPAEGGGLRDAMATIAEYNVDLMGDAAEKRARRLGWDVIAGEIAGLYEV